MLSPLYLCVYRFVQFLTVSLLGMNEFFLSSSTVFLAERHLLFAA